MLRASFICGAFCMLLPYKRLPHGKLFIIQPTIIIIIEMFPCISTRVPTFQPFVVWSLKCHVKVAHVHDLDVKPPNIDEANVDTFNPVGSPNQWIQALEAWACLQLRMKSKQIWNHWNRSRWRYWSRLWNHIFFAFRFGLMSMNSFIV